MFQPVLFGPGVSVQHQHADGSWSPMEPEDEPLDPADGDPEKDWLKGRVFACTRCSERIRIEVAGDEWPADVPGTPT